jgi:hypothetical protein
MLFDTETMCQSSQFIIRGAKKNLTKSTKTDFDSKSVIELNFHLFI